MQRGSDHIESSFTLAPTAPWERVGIDFIEPLSETEKGNKYIITAIDYFTKWPEAKAVSAAIAQIAVRCLYEKIICRYGLVKFFYMDRGIHFNNELMQRMTSKFKVRYH